MKGTLHIILGTPGSERRSVLSKSNSSNDSGLSYFLLPEELKDESLPHSLWDWDESQFRFDRIEDESAEEFFLFFSNNFNIADQFEATLKILESEDGLDVGRVIVFINSKLLVDNNDQITTWIDAATHFADAVCFSHRENDNAAHIAKCKERYESMRYPLETYLLGKKKDPPLERILSPSTRRISHVFDPQDLLDPEDSPTNDPYLSRQANGKRHKPIPTPFAS